MNSEFKQHARELVKAELRRQGIKLSHVDAKDIAKAAKVVLDIHGKDWQSLADAGY